jgi:1,4-dihydroxy-2-naphthoate polyprenyltransferase
MIVFGSYYVLYGKFSWEPVFASIPLGIFTMNVGIVSNTFDYEDDVKSGKKCIPVRFGQKNAVRIIITGTVIAYIGILAGVLLNYLPTWSLLALFTIPLAVNLIRLTQKYDDTEMYTPAMSKAIALTSVTGILMIIAYLL